MYSVKIHFLPLRSIANVSSVSPTRCLSLELESQATLGLPSISINAQGFSESEIGKNAHGPSDRSLSSLVLVLRHPGTVSKASFHISDVPKLHF